ncbi:MAG: transketolase [Spirochaetales bacterium]|nr:transketolase [Spirochaetales bacterium]
MEYNGSLKTLDERVAYLENKAREVRIEIVKMIYASQSGHPGGALSAADMVTALYFDIMNLRPEEPRWPARDRFVISKGHACPVVYACLAMRGFFPMEALGTLRRFESILQGHPDMRKTPGLDMTTGSLGQGLSMGLGIAMEGNMLGASYKVFVLLGDGEIQEGQVWEAAASASARHLGNLIALVDNNHLQMDGHTDKILPMASIEEKFRAFGWEVLSINGHDMREVLLALELARGTTRSKPVCIVADTVKGKGVSFMEDLREWHGMAPDSGQLKRALEELGGDR